ncbi:hypothetical protein [Pseudomonas sp. S11A4]|uniref:hypothetical protein n=1 Tax=Pseudomonas sp. S11A4 TaxID=1476791 RepID=UPI00406C3DC7
MEQAAKNFNPSTYGARIWLEHYRSADAGQPAIQGLRRCAGREDREVDISGQKRNVVPELSRRRITVKDKAKQKISRPSKSTWQA